VLNTNSDTENINRAAQSSEDRIKDRQLHIFYGKKAVLEDVLQEVYKSKRNEIIQNKSIKLFSLLHLSTPSIYPFVG